MRKLVVAEFVSLDGVMQAPGGAEEDMEGGFTHGGWTMPYWHDDMGTTLFEEINKADTFLLGRKTWQGHAEAFEPAPADDPFAGLLNGLKKYVVSTTLKSADAWRNSTIISDNVVDEVRKLKEQPGKAIYVDGSSVLVTRWRRRIWWMNTACSFFRSYWEKESGSFRRISMQV